jgi:hypothetical protein
MMMRERIYSNCRPQQTVVCCHESGIVDGHILSRIASQIKLLVWKRYVEATKNFFEFLRILGPPFIFFVLIHLAYATFDFLSPGGVPWYSLVSMQDVVISTSRSESGSNCEWSTHFHCQ